MPRHGRLCLCALLCLLCCAPPAWAAATSDAAPSAAAPAAPAPKAAKARAKARPPRRAAKKPAPKAEKPALTVQELTAPYSAMQGGDNATAVPGFDPTPKSGPFAQPDKDAAVNLHLSREKVIDPLTGKDITPKSDPAGARESLKGGDLKGAVDKLGGKAEVQVEILKF